MATVNHDVVNDEIIAMRKQALLTSGLAKLGALAKNPRKRYEVRTTMRNLDSVMEYMDGLHSGADQAMEDRLMKRIEDLHGNKPPQDPPPPQADGMKMSLFASAFNKLVPVCTSRASSSLSLMTTWRSPF